MKHNQIVDSESLFNKYLTFELAEEFYAINILKVREIIEKEDITTMPMVPEFVRGAINLRGRAVPVIDLAKRLGVGEVVSSKRTCIIIVEMIYAGRQVYVGVLVDAVSKVVDLNMADIEEAPSMGDSLNTDYIEGLGKLNERFVVILSIDKVLSLEDLKLMAEAIEDEVVEENILQDTASHSQLANE